MKTNIFELYDPSRKTWDKFSNDEFFIAEGEPSPPPPPPMNDTEKETEAKRIELQKQI